MSRLSCVVLVVGSLAPGAALSQSVPPSKEELAARATKAEAAGAVSTAMEVKSALHHVPSITDAYTGNNYKAPINGYGEFIGKVGGAASIVEGYYREGSEGAYWAGWKVAAELGVEEFATWAAGAKWAASASGLPHPAAPVVDAGAAGYFAGKVLDHYAGDYLADKIFGTYERNFMDRPSDAQLEQLAAARRARFQAMKARNAADAAAALASTPVASEYASQPSALDTFMGTMMQMQLQQMQAYPQQSPTRPGVSAQQARRPQTPVSSTPAAPVQTYRDSLCPALEIPVGSYCPNR
jgi:hypothetical protein